MKSVRNVLFIMCDQLRADYLGCYGHPALKTPNIDALAASGVRFTQAHTSSPVCGPARMSLYTGRTAFSHGATWNFVPLNIGEPTLGDYLRPHGVRVALAGKTHMRADVEGMARLGIAGSSNLGVLAAECGFEPWERDDGEHPNAKFDPDLAYNRWLRRHGYDGPNPWNDFANSATGPDGDVLSGWALRHCPYPARIAAAHSETTYMTNRALDFMRDAGDDPWVLHLSYIKPHWPYIAPAPYNNLYGVEDMLAACKDERERTCTHPVLEAFMGMEVGRTFAKEETRRSVIPAYMGLVKEIDDHLGRVMAYLRESGRIDDTMIIFTSDHGDYLGDHWLGEKELFHDASVRVPLIICDPDQEADASRGTTDDRMVEGIDIVPTILDAMKIDEPAQRIEGRSVLPVVRGQADSPWREAAFSEIDYSHYQARLTVDVAPDKARAYMLRTPEWKYIHYKGFDPQLFDLKKDPQEFDDLGRSPDHLALRNDMQSLLLDRLTDRRNRVTMSDQAVADRTAGAEKVGIIIGRW